MCIYTRLYMYDGATYYRRQLRSEKGVTPHEFAQQRAFLIQEHMQQMDSIRGEASISVEVYERGVGRERGRGRMGERKRETETERGRERRKEREKETKRERERERK